MLNKFIAITFLTVTLGMASAAQAEEQYMNLWPKQRAGHDSVMADHTASYEARGKAYTEHLYATGGEVPMEPDVEFSGGEIQPVPINIGQVAEMVKSTGDVTVTQQPSPSTQTAATPQ